jgi:hypothetical protein
MWAACVVAAIALSAAAFMLTFLVALLREGAPSVCYWVVPVRREAQLENKRYVRKESESVLVPLNLRPGFDNVGWSSVDSTRGHLFREHRFKFDRSNRTAGNAG